MMAKLNVPVIVAVNKIDRPDADPTRVRNELLSHEIVVEEVGGEVQSVEVSATEKTNLDKLTDAIVVQAEVLELKANPDRAAEQLATLDQTHVYALARQVRSADETVVASPDHHHLRLRHQLKV